MAISINVINKFINELLFFSLLITHTHTHYDNLLS